MTVSADPDLEQELRRFFVEKIRPEVAVVNAKRRRALLTSIAVALAVFVLLALAVWYFTGTFREGFGEYGVSLWPMYILLPLTIGVLVFSALHIIFLKTAVSAFRAVVIDRLAEFIDPGLVHEAGRTMPTGEFNESLLFGSDKVKAPNAEYFRGGLANGARYEFCEIVVKRGGRNYEGVFLSAKMPHDERGLFLLLPGDAEASLSGIAETMKKTGVNLDGELVRYGGVERGWQLVLPSASADSEPPPELISALEETRRKCGVDIFMSRYGSRIYLATANPRDGAQFTGYLQNFDFDRCLEFCRDARLCLAV
ncbi:MAG: hypothetical protein LIP23_01045, partial [Planctomycetes bacterium]|nr:hypothetical protein [Planctomycetota bacterium]